MTKTVHRGGYKIVNRPTEISDDDWDLAFKRDKKNPEKNRYAKAKDRTRTYE